MVSALERLFSGRREDRRLIEGQMPSLMFIPWGFFSDRQTNILITQQQDPPQPNSLKKSPE